MTKRPLMLLLFGVAACANTDDGARWHRDGEELSVNSPDAYECVRDAKTTGPTYYEGWGVYQRGLDGSMLNACLRAKGYRYFATIAPSSVDPYSPPTPLQDASGRRYGPQDWVWCGWTGTAPVRFQAGICSQGRGTIVGPA